MCGDLNVYQRCARVRHRIEVQSPFSVAHCLPPIRAEKKTTRLEKRIANVT